MDDTRGPVAGLVIVIEVPDSEQDWAVGARLDIDEYDGPTVSQCQQRWVVV